MKNDKVDYILSFYGGEHQLIKCSEELSELLVVINKILIDREDKVFDDAFNEHKIQLVGELADVYVTVMQIAKFVGEDVFWKKVDYKLDRQIERIKERRCEV